MHVKIKKNTGVQLYFFLKLFFIPDVVSNIPDVVSVKGLQGGSAGVALQCRAGFYSSGEQTRRVGEGTSGGRRWHSNAGRASTSLSRDRKGKCWAVNIKRTPNPLSNYHTFTVFAI